MGKTKYYLHLAKDQQLLPLLDSITPRELKKRSNVCLRLCASIMSQQLSTKVADVIFKRFLAIYETGEPTPQQIIDTPTEALRAIGLSNAKVNYVHNVARYFQEHNLSDRTFDKLDHDAVMELLLPIKGVGKWTIEMLLMFTLGKEDVFAVDDLGIQQAMTKIYALDASNKKQLTQKMLEISNQWSPYRTYACFYLWDFKDKK